MEKRKIKLLFVVGNFHQAGSQKYVYEIDKAINREKFEVHILSIHPLNHSAQWADYYYKLHEENGSQIHFYAEYANSLFFRLKLKIGRVFENKLALQNVEFNNFLDGFDVISWIGEYTLKRLAGQVSDKVIEKSFIHIMSLKIQTHANDPNLNGYDKQKLYNFISGIKTDAEVKYELSDFKEYTHSYFPLCFEIRNTSNTWHFKENKSPKKIGVFSRLDYSRPIDPFFYAFHLLTNRMPDLELHIFGTGDPAKAGAERCVKNLHVEDKVYFRGHSTDILETASEEDFDLLWFQGFNGVPGGYGGYELCITGVPQIYWELSPQVENRTYSEGYPCFTNLDEFVKRSKLLLSDKNAAELQSKKQFVTTEDDHNIKKWMPKLEELYEAKYKELLPN